MTNPRNPKPVRAWAIIDCEIIQDDERALAIYDSEAKAKQNLMLGRKEQVVEVEIRVLKRLKGTRGRKL